MRLRSHCTFANLVGLIGAGILLACLLLLPDEQFWNIRSAVYLTLCVWTLISPRIALYFLPIAIPWGSLDSFGGITSADILTVLLVTSWLLSYTLRPLVNSHSAFKMKALDYEEERQVPPSIAISLLLVVLTMIFSSIAAINLVDSAKEILKWCEALAVLLLGTQYIRTHRQIWIIVGIMLLAGLSQAILGFAQLTFNLGPESFIRDDSLRIYGTFDQPNPYAGYINMMLLPALALLLLGSSWGLRFLALSFVIPLALAEYYSQSKGGWIALALSATLIIICSLSKSHRRVLIRIGFVFVLVVISMFLSGLAPTNLLVPLLEEMGVVGISFNAPTSDNYANSERIAHWVAGLNMFKDAPITGVGAGNYEHAYAAYAPGIFVLPLGHAHNYYIHMAAETGLFGFIAFSCFIVATIVVGAKICVRVEQRLSRTVQIQVQRDTGPRSHLERVNALEAQRILKNDRALAVGLFAALASVCIHNMVDNLYVHGMAMLFALLLAILIRLDRVS